METGVLFLLFLVGLAYGNDKCKAYNDLKELVCSNISGSFAMPDLGSKKYKVETIIVKDSNISLLTDLTFSHFTNVHTLKLDAIQLEKIEVDAFEGLGLLKELRIINNKIKELHPRTFRTRSKFDNLKILSLANNHIEDIEEKLFDNFFRLETLELKNNNISVLKGAVFRVLTGLKTLDLSDNPLQVFLVESLPPLLSELNLKHCQLYHNVSFLRVPNVEYINLDYNKMVTLTAPFFEDAAKLTVLSLQNNLIHLIRKEYFLDLTSLQKLHLGYNRITKIEIGFFTALVNLKELNLNDNEISTVVHGAFENLAKLEILNLARNHLDTLPQYTFLPLVSLKELRFDSNKISSFDAEALLRHLRNLTYIKLDINRWNCKRLIPMQKVFRSSRLTVEYGRVYDEDNVYGLPCGTHEPKSEDEIFDQIIKESEIKTFFSQSFRESRFFEFFYSDFDATTFFENMNIEE